MSETDMRVYELGYLLVPTMPETEVPSQVDSIKKVVTDLGGTVHSSGMPEFIDLAYQMEKNIASKKMKWSQGYFGWLKFDATPESIEALKKALDGNAEIIRYLITKTSLENSVIFKKPKIEAKRSSAEDETELSEEVVEEEDIQPVHEKLPDLDEDVLDVEVKEGEE